MSLFGNCSVQYDPEYKDNSWYSLAEEAADICRAPCQWVESELRSGGKKYVLTKSDDNLFKAEEVETNCTRGIQKVLRIVIGSLLSLPGKALAVPLMAYAFSSEEIRLKHQIVCRELTSEEQKKLIDLIEERQRLAKERQGCDPIISPCILASICCMLCCIICCK